MLQMVLMLQDFRMTTLYFGILRTLIHVDMSYLLCLRGLLGDQSGCTVPANFIHNDLASSTLYCEQCLDRACMHCIDICLIFSFIN